MQRMRVRLYSSQSICGDAILLSLAEEELISVAVVYDEGRMLNLVTWLCLCRHWGAVFTTLLTEVNKDYSLPPLQNIHQGLPTTALIRIIEHTSSPTLFITQTQRLHSYLEQLTSIHQSTPTSPTEHPQHAPTTPNSPLAQQHLPDPLPLRPPPLHPALLPRNRPPPIRKLHPRSAPHA